jgi:hypothetical protein
LFGSVQFGYFILKTKNYIVFLGFLGLSNGLDFGLVRFFYFFRFGSVFRFQAYETESNWIFFFKYSNQFNRFFSCIGFFSFLSLIGFVVFFLIVFLQFSSKTKALLWCYKKTKTILDHDKKHLKSYEVWRKHIWIRGQHGQDHKLTTLLCSAGGEIPSQYKSQII